MSIRQDLEALFFWSGVQELYEHWQAEEISGRSSRFRRYGQWEKGEAPDVWAYQITVTDPLSSERLLKKVITYSVIYTAMEMINEGRVSTDKPFHPGSAETGRACASLIHCDELDGFDPHTIDEVLQVAVYGGIRHPHFEIPD